MAETLTAAQPAQDSKPKKAKPGKPGRSGKADKQPKDKRSKAQIQADGYAAESRKMLDYWLQLKSYIILAFGRGQITPEAEQKFLALTTALQKQQRVISPAIPGDIDFGGDKMIEFLRTAISLDHLRSLPEPDKRTLYSAWHSVYILLTRAVGAMRFIADGYQHKVERQENQLGTRALIHGARSDYVEEPWHHNPSIWTMIVVGIVVAVFLMNYLNVINLF